MLYCWNQQTFIFILIFIFVSVFNIYLCIKAVTTKRFCSLNVNFLQQGDNTNQKYFVSMMQDTYQTGKSNRASAHCHEYLDFTPVDPKTKSA